MPRFRVWVGCIAGSLAAGATLGSIALMAVPSRYRPGVETAETEIVDALRQLAEAQRKFAAGTFVDLDGDGLGEFGFLGELAGGSRLRIDVRARLGAAVLQNPLVPIELAAIAAGVAERGDYALQLFLPAPGSGWIAEADDGGGAGCLVDVDRSERSFRIYAWPLAAGRGQRAFCIDETGDVRVCANAARHYEDRDRPVAAGAVDTDGGELAWTALQP